MSPVETVVGSGERDDPDVRPVAPGHAGNGALPRLGEAAVAGRDCPLCGGNGVPAGSRDGYALRECCGVLLSWPWESVEAYRRWYEAPEAYHRDEQLREGQAPSLARDTVHLGAARCRLALLRELDPRLRTLLDIGAGTGAFVAQASAFGYDARGLDPCARLAAFARELGREVKAGSWEAARGEYDVVTLNDVWEHLTQPLACLEHLRGILRPAGLLVVELPEWRSPHAEREGAEWRHVRLRQHLFLPSDPAARALFRRAGLEVDAAIRPLRGALGKIAYYLSAG